MGNSKQFSNVEKSKGSKPARFEFACHFDRREKSFFVSDFDIRIADFSPIR